jgi:LmbE family N-acetylglucosaminyl deacetylase
VTILAVSPHPDDVELGCFGTLARLARSEPVVIVLMTSGEFEDPAIEREREAQESAKIIGASVEFLRFPDAGLSQNANSVGQIRMLLKRHQPTTVFAPFGEDTHQDHLATYRIVVSSAAYTKEILLYETPSSIGFRPNVFYDITETLPIKHEALAQFKTQADRPYLDPALVDGQARYYALRLQQKGRAFEAFLAYRSVR